MPTYRVCQLARRHVTVALSGDGGDENFGGYRRYRLHMLEEKLRQPLPLALRKPMFGLLGRVYPKADWAPRVLRGKTTFEALARDSVEAYFHSMSLLRDADRRTLYSNGFRAALAGYNAIEVFRRHARRANHDDPLALIQYLDLKTYLVGDINTKVDRASMAHSLEVREPLMDHPLVEWLATLPSSMKLRGGEGKWFLKQAMEPHAAARPAVPAEDGICRAAGQLVPRTAEPARARCGPGRSTRGQRILQRRYAAPACRPAPVWHARPQRAALEPADVRGIPAHERPERTARHRSGECMTRDVRLLTLGLLYPRAVLPHHAILWRGASAAYWREADRVCALWSFPGCRWQTSPPPC